MAKPPRASIQAVFGALAHEARRNILVILSHLGGELPSGYLAARFQHSWPTTTRHLTVLEKAGLVSVRRVGRGSFYCLNRDYVQKVLEAWLRHLEPVGPDKTWSSSGPRSTDALREQNRSQNRPKERPHDPPRQDRHAQDLPRHPRSLKPRRGR
jgi:DNA-binding transcriptional ArsR family regulator